MGVFDAFRSFITGSKTQEQSWVGPALRSMVLGLTPEELYRTQPHLRIVLSFVARNVAHLGLKAYGRDADGSRTRLRDDPVSLLLKRPNPQMTGFELIETLASDLGLYDIAYWVVTEDADSPSGWLIRPIPPSWVKKRRGGSLFDSEVYVVHPPKGERVEVPSKDMLVFHGWNPGRPKDGTSPVETLKQVLAEQVQAWSYREQVWQRGGRVGAYITRPKDAAWSDAARERFASDWKERWTGVDGKKAGGTPILEDGMTLNRLGFSAREDEWADVAKLALSTVAAVYHVNPVMVGILDNANFSNTKEFRKMLYSETLGPQLARIEDRINTFLVPKISGRDDVYVEFNIEEKLQGDFEEQAAILSTSAGAPWMTRNEVRALRNLPAIDGGSELVVPLNVLTGGQASPRDGVTSGGGGSLPAALSADDVAKRVTAAAALIRSGFNPSASLEAVGLDPIEHLGLLPATVQRPKEPDQIDEEIAEALKTFDLGELRQMRPVRAKAQASDQQRQLLEDVMLAFFERQSASVLSALGAKDGKQWWDSERWNNELAADLHDLAMSVSAMIGKDVAKSMGFTADNYDVDRTEAFLREVAASRASAINATTREQIEAVLNGTGPEGMNDPAHVFEKAEEVRTAVIAVTFLTTIAAFATVEAGKQNGAATKTWIVTSSNPRASHAAMNGQTVAINEPFSNGANWPGDPALGVDGVAGCECDVEVNFG